MDNDDDDVDYRFVGGFIYLALYYCSIDSFPDFSRTKKRPRKTFARDFWTLSGSSTTWSTASLPAGWIRKFL